MLSSEVEYRPQTILSVKIGQLVCVSEHSVAFSVRNVSSARRARQADADLELVSF